MSDQATYRLSRNAFGRLVFTEANGAVREGVIPVRAFPITAPDRAIALIDQHGHELAWIEQLSDLPDELRAIVAAELATREFIPEIRRIRECFELCHAQHLAGGNRPRRYVFHPQGRRRYPAPCFAISAHCRQSGRPVPDS